MQPSNGWKIEKKLLGVFKKNYFIVAPMTEQTTAENIKDVQLAGALSERYLAYAMSTIVARSLPDVRDGLKPVHCRLLYAMRQLKLVPIPALKMRACGG